MALHHKDLVKAEKHLNEMNRNELVAYGMEVMDCTAMRNFFKDGDASEKELARGGTCDEVKDGFRRVLKSANKRVLVDTIYSYASAEAIERMSREYEGG
jgi:hypothetical protein